MAVDIEGTAIRTLEHERARLVQQLERVQAQIAYVDREIAHVRACWASQVSGPAKGGT